MSALWPIIKQVLRTPNRIAVIDDQRRYTFAQILGGAFVLADRIDSMTSARHVGIMLPTSGAFPIGLLGIWLAKRTAVPLNYLLSSQELTYVIGDSDIDTMITAGPMLEFLAHSTPTQDSSTPPNGIPSHIKQLLVDQTDFSGAPALRWPPLACRDDLAVILYTSGTSGRPKGVMLTHGNLRSNVEAAIEHAGLTSEDAFFGVLPQFHSFGLTALTLLPLYLGATTTYSARFVPKRIVSLIRKHRPAVFVAVPSMYGALLAVKDAKPDDFASIRLAVSGGEPLPQAIFDKYQHQLGLRLLEGYGLTETAPMTNWSTPEHSKPRSVGTTLPGVCVVVVDDHDHPVPPGQKGHILIAGPNVMRGYHKLPTETQSVFVDLQVDPRYGWLPTHHPNRHEKAQRFFRTGDIGHLDDDGFLFITGRQKEMLIIAGENVFPREIEEVLNQHTSVRDSAVIGQSSDLRGELPVAFVEIQESEIFDETALRSWCRDNLAGYKVPRQIHRIDTLPRSPTGKILRRQLAAR